MPGSSSRKMSKRGRGRSAAEAEALRGLKLLVLDVDGVLTDGSLLYGPEGEVFKRFHVHDGFGVECLLNAGLHVAIISRKRSGALMQRAQELGIKRVVQACMDKGSALRALAEDLGCSLSETAYVGDDLFDLPAIRIAGWSAAPPGARQEVKAAASHVCAAEGGSGAVREVTELILKAKGAWPPEGTT